MAGDAPGLQNQCGARKGPGWVRFPFTSAISWSEPLQPRVRVGSSARAVFWGRSRSTGLGTVTTRRGSK